MTNYDADSGYSPAYHAAVLDLDRLCSGKGSVIFVGVVNMLSYGRGKDKTGKRFDSTLPMSVAELAEMCSANVRDIQRYISEMADMGMITAKRSGKGKYVISLRYRDWPDVEDYAVWKRRQVVSIDTGTDDEPEPDEDAVPISQEAVRLTKHPEKVKPGRATRAKPVNVGVKSFRFQSTDTRLDLIHEAVIQSGCLVVSVSCADHRPPEHKEVRNSPERGSPSKQCSVNVHPCRGVTLTWG